jgi:hypothetical protein
MTVVRDGVVVGMVQFRAEAARRYGHACERDGADCEDDRDRVKDLPAGDVTRLARRARIRSNMLPPRLI